MRRSGIYRLDGDRSLAELKPSFTGRHSNDSFAFDDMQVAVWGNVTEPLDLFAWGRPMYLQLIDASRLADSKDFARVMRGKITAAITFQARSSFSSCFPDDPGANCIAVARYAFQLQSKPIIAGGRVVLEEKWSTPIYPDNDVQRTVVV